MATSFLFSQSALLAQTGDELLQSARSSHSTGVLLGQAACLVFAALFLYAAYTTAKNGFNITEESKLTGMPARAIAGAFVVVALGIGVFALWFLPKMAF